MSHISFKFEIFQVFLAIKNHENSTASILLSSALIQSDSVHQTLEAATGGVLQKVVHNNFTKLTGKHLCQSLFFNNFIKKETLAQVLSCEFCEIFRNTFFYRTPPVAAS